MPRIRNLFPGGNTCFGFYSFYDYMVSPRVRRKIILKGGPGVGKSSFMKNVGEEFFSQGYDLEFHWCSSDNESLDGVVIGNQDICLLDGTAPHIVDPHYPGAADEIINLGQFWQQKTISKNRAAIVGLTQTISRCFEQAYRRLQDSKLAWEEWESYYQEARDDKAVNRNILALTRDFLNGLNDGEQDFRHIFPAAITPAGVVSKIDSLIDINYSLFAVKGSPGSGIRELFAYTWQTLQLMEVKAEIYHNPFNPDYIDIIIIPSSRLILLDISGHLFDYASLLSGIKHRRMLDFDQLGNQSALEAGKNYITSAQDRFYTGLNDAVGLLRKAKTYHDELESYYIPAMDFAALEEMRQELCQQLRVTLGR